MGEIEVDDTFIDVLKENYSFSSGIHEAFGSQIVTVKREKTLTDCPKDWGEDNFMLKKEMALNDS